MANAVYPIPNTPNREKGASDFRFFKRHSGNKTRPVTANRVAFRGFPNKVEKVSAKTMLKAKQAKKVLKVHDQAGIQLVDSPTDLAHA